MLHNYWITKLLLDNYWITKLLLDNYWLCSLNKIIKALKKVPHKNPLSDLDKLLGCAKPLRRDFSGAHIFPCKKTKTIRSKLRQNCFFYSWIRRHLINCLL